MHRTRMTTLAALVAATSLMVGGAVSAQSPDASMAAPAESMAAPAESMAAPGSSDLKIGVVTDVGTLDDKNFNEYTFKGAEDGAAAVGAETPPSIVPKDASEYAADIQGFIDQGYNTIVTTGFNLGGATTQAAHDNPDVWFIGVDQTPICVDADGLPDATFACSGDAATLLPKYIAVGFQEDQAGYLAGIVAASISKSGSIAAIGGTSACAPCVRYIQGYELGAKSVNPDVTVNTAYVVTDFSNTAFNDPTAGNNFAQQFLAQYPDTDVMFQVAGKTGNGVLQATCNAKINGIGVDVDQYLSLNAASDPTYGCIVTSAEKHLQSAVSQTIQAIAAGTAAGGNVTFNASNDGIGVADSHDKASMITPETQQALDDALAAMKAGTLTTCPENCGTAN